MPAEHSNFKTLKMNTALKIKIAMIWENLGLYINQLKPLKPQSCETIPWSKNPQAVKILYQEIKLRLDPLLS
jgi:hypothetical protein